MKPARIRVISDTWKEEDIPYFTLFLQARNRFYFKLKIVVTILKTHYNFLTGLFQYIQDYRERESSITFTVQKKTGKDAVLPFIVKGYFYFTCRNTK